MSNKYRAGVGSQGPRIDGVGMAASLTSNRPLRASRLSKRAGPSTSLRNICVIWRTSSTRASSTRAMSSPSPPGAYVVGIDFDGTITERDTCEIIVKSAMRDSGGFEEGREKWKELVELYIAEQGEFMRTAPTSSVTEFCEASRVFDRRMNRDFVSSGLLKGARAASLKKDAQQVKLRQGAKSLISDLLTAAVNPKPGSAAVDLHVVSLCWSATFLREALQLPPQLKQRLSVHANELVWEENGACAEGEIAYKLQDPLDKSDLMSRLCREGAAAEGRASSQAFSVFVGDSIGDLHAMVSADVGLVMGEEVGRSIRYASGACGVHIAEVAAHQSLSDLRVARDDFLSDSPSSGGVIFSVKSWRDLRALFEAEGLVKREENPATVLCISGSDSGGGAGNQADIKTCASYGVFATSALTALTAQNTRGVSAISDVDADFVGAQIEAVASDIGVDAVKTGMLATKDIVRTVARQIKARNLGNVVVDPVLVATSGDALARDDIIDAFLMDLFPLASVVTPNIPEAETLLGWDRGRIKSVEDSISGARALREYGPDWVLVKGGHLSSEAGKCVDVLYDGEEVHRLESEMVATENTHGTGCTLGSAIACGLAGGLDMLSAVKTAKAYVSQVIADSAGLSLGHESVQGAMHHQALRTRVSSGFLRDPSTYKFYAVTDSKINEKNGRNLADAVVAAVQGGATIVQLREKHASTADLIEQVGSSLSLSPLSSLPLPLPSF